MKFTSRGRRLGLLPVVLYLTLSLLVLGSLSASAFPRTVIDGLGNEIELETPPQRIFSTGLAIDNLLLSVVDPDRVVGITRFAADDSYVIAQIRPHMIQVDALSPEYIIAGDPDLVLVASWNDPDAVLQIRNLGYVVYTFTAFDGVDDALDNIIRIGELTGDEAAAQQLVDDFHAQYNRIKQRIAGLAAPRVLYWNSWDSSAGLGTSIDDIIRLAGGMNVVSDAGIAGWPQMDYEFVLQANPDVIITDSGEQFAAQLLQDPVLASVSAIQSGNVYSIEHMDALSHHFILAIEALARVLHPTAFEAQD